MKSRALMTVSTMIAASTLAAGEPEKAETALEFLKAFEPPHRIDRNPEREYIPKGQAMMLDGGTRITVIRAKDGRKIAVSYYGMNRQLKPDRDGLLSFCGFTDKSAYTKPSYRLKRGSEEEALLAKIMLSLPLRREYPELKKIIAAQMQKQAGERRFTESREPLTLVRESDHDCAVHRRESVRKNGK